MGAQRPVLSHQPIFVDSSALVKLVRHEPESEALFADLQKWSDRVSSVVARIEVYRALRRTGATPADRARTEELFSAVTLVRLDDPILKLAASLPDRHLGSLDAIQLATALSIGDLPEAFITYDLQLAKAARRHGLRVLQPGP